MSMILSKDEMILDAGDKLQAKKSFTFGPHHDKDIMEEGTKATFKGIIVRNGEVKVCLYIKGHGTMHASTESIADHFEAVKEERNDVEYL